MVSNPVISHPGPTNLPSKNQLPDVLLEPIVRNALAEDLGRTGDVTSLAVIEPGHTCHFQLRARTTGILSGCRAAELTWTLLNPQISVTWHRVDGDALNSGDLIADIVGDGVSLLSGERVALNFLGHLSGIASVTRRLVDAVAGTSARIADTRKTTPGLRSLEKAAVRHGGGMNHRYGLDDAVMIKDNHIVAAGGLTAAVQRARAYVGHLVKIEVEVDTLAQLDELLAISSRPGVGADVVLLDNMTPPTLSQAVATVRKSAPFMVIEASGTVREDTVRAIAETGVDVISSGFLTHSAPCLDIGLDEVRI